MYPQPRGIASYGRVANTETNPLAQIVMLYDGAIKFLNMTARDIEANDLVAKGEHSGRALEIITYLQTILDFERGGSAAQSLDKLYRSITKLVLRASAELDPTLMRKAAELLSPVRDAWETNARNAAASAIPAPAATSSVEMKTAPVSLAF